MGENSGHRGDRGENGVRRGDKMMDVPSHIYPSQGNEVFKRSREDILLILEGDMFNSEWKKKKKPSLINYEIVVLASFAAN
jgi:hypothetical protein